MTSKILCRGWPVSPVLDRYRRYQLKTSDLFGLDSSNLNQKSASKGWTILQTPFPQALRPLDPGQGNATCAGAEHALVLGTNALLLGYGNFLSAKLPMVSGFQRDDNFSMAGI